MNHTKSTSPRHATTWPTNACYDLPDPCHDNLVFGTLSLLDPCLRFHAKACERCSQTPNQIVADLIACAMGHLRIQAHREGGASRGP